jgi:hypothetical protein
MNPFHLFSSARLRACVRAVSVRVRCVWVRAVVRKPLIAGACVCVCVTNERTNVWP